MSQITYRSPLDCRANILHLKLPYKANIPEGVYFIIIEVPQELAWDLEETSKYSDTNIP